VASWWFVIFLGAETLLPINDLLPMVIIYPGCNDSGATARVDH